MITQEEMDDLQELLVCVECSPTTRDEIESLRTLADAAKKIADRIESESGAFSWIRMLRNTPKRENVNR